MGTTIKLGEVLSANQNGTSDLEWKKQIKSWFCYYKRRFCIKFQKQMFTLVKVKTCDTIYTKMERQPSQETEYANWGKQKCNN